MRALGIIVITVLAFGLFAEPAFAGGSWIDAYKESYLPGETVMMRADIGEGQLGWVEDGPFYAYLRVDPDAGDNAQQFPYIAESDVFLGEMQVTEKTPTLVHVSLEFLVPTDLPDGEYWVVYCNDPCTTGIGDLMGGWFVVKTPRAPAPPRPARLICFSPLHPV